jgi:hypothetical protein
VWQRVWKRKEKKRPKWLYKKWKKRIGGKENTSEREDSKDKWRRPVGLFGKKYELELAGT